MLEHGSLTGLRILDLSRMLPGPFCSMILADHGAEVISIEDRRFHEDGLFFNLINRNKKHISLNLKSEAGKTAFYKLAEQSDVIIEGFRPGVVKRLAVDYQSMRQLNERLIYCSISGYGQYGPYAMRAGHDINYLSATGILDLIGPSSGSPSIPGVQFGDISGGSLNSVAAILLALYARTKTGRGQYLDISMTDGLLGCLNLPAHFFAVSGRQPKRADDLLSHRYACYNIYATADDKYMAVGALEHRFWQRLCELLGLPEYIDCQYEESCREELIARFRETFAQKSGVEWERLLGDEDVCCTRIKTFEEVLEDEHFRHRDMIVNDPQTGASAGVMFGIAAKLSETPGTIRTPPSAFGADTSEVLMTLGYGGEQIADLHESGSVYCAERQ